MIRSLSAEPPKPKQKGTRSVSNLTPAQRARKRANDREAQRVIRARTKEHIKRLERELEELKSKQSRDQTVQGLLRRNKAIEKELIRLKQIMRLSLPAELLTPTVYDGNLSTGSDAIPSPHGSPFSGDYNSLPDYSQQYIPLSNNCESLVSTVSYTIPSSVSTPSSSVDYSTGYIPTSAPTSVLASNSTSSSSLGTVCDKGVAKMEYDEMGHHGTIPQEIRLPDMRHGEEVSHVQYPDDGFRLSHPPLHPATPYSHPYMPHQQQQQSAWNMYPMYYPQPHSSVR